MSQINTNNYSLNAQRNLANNSRGLASALERLSSGLRVNSARDDASGLASGSKIDAESRITQVNIRLEQDKISANQIWDNAMSVVADIQTRAIELAATGSTTTATEFAMLSAQAASIQSEAILKIGTFASTAAGTMGFALASANITGTTATGNLDAFNNQRTSAGASMNNSEFRIQALRAQYEGQQAARSRIMDADFAEETSRLSRFQVLQQAGTAMVAQANALPQNVLSLLR